MKKKLFGNIIYLQSLPSTSQNQILDIILESERPGVNQAKKNLVKAQKELKYN